MRKHKYNIIILLALVGLGISIYLTFAHYLDYQVPCSVTHGCQIVLTSKYSAIFGVPIAAFGAGYFLVALFAAWQAKFKPGWRGWLLGLLGAGALISLVLLFIQFFILKRVCQYCLTIDLLNIFIFLWALNISDKENI